MSPTKVSRMFRTLAFSIVIIAALYLALCAALFVFQRALIYFPQPSAIATPASLLTLTVEDAQVQVSVRPHDGPNALIYFGGNAEDVSAQPGRRFPRRFPNMRCT